MCVRPIWSLHILGLYLSVWYILVRAKMIDQYHLKKPYHLQYDMLLMLTRHHDLVNHNSLSYLSDVWINIKYASNKWVMFADGAELRLERGITPGSHEQGNRWSHSNSWTILSSKLRWGSPICESVCRHCGLVMYFILIIILFILSMEDAKVL